MWEERYRIETLLGSGGQARSWLATDARSGLKVVIKEIQGFDDERLAREYRLLARLDHPNIAPASDFYRDSVRQLMVRRFVAGVDLAEGMHHLAPSSRLLAVAAVMRALQYLHRCGAVHGDIKPSNIVLSDGLVGGLPAAILLDFGLAGAIGEPASGATPHYAAPEILAGQPLAAACDLYGIGVLIAELYGLRDQAPGAAGLLPRLRRQGVLPPPLTKLLERLLAPDPDDRPDATGTLRELEALMDRPLQISAPELRTGFMPQPLLVERDAQLAEGESALQRAAAGERLLLQLIGTGKRSFCRELTPTARLLGMRWYRIESGAALLQTAGVADEGSPLAVLADEIVASWEEERRPLVVELEQHALDDPLVGALVRRLETGAGASGLGGLCAIACGELPRWSIGSRWQSIALPRLSAPAVEKLVRQLLYPVAQLPWLEDLKRAADGDPALVCQLVRAQVDAGLPQALVPASAAATAPVPHDLSQDQLALLTTLAHCPAMVPLRVLEAATAGGVLQLGALLARGIVTVEDSSVTFAEPLHRYPIASNTPPEARHAINQELARAWMVHGAPDPGIIGHHWARSANPELGAPYLLAALAPTSEDLRLTIAALDPSDANWRALVARLARIERARGHLAEALDLVEEATTHDTGYFGLLRAELLLDAGRPAAALDALAPTDNNTPTAQLIEARALVMQGDFEGAASLARRALAQPDLSPRIALRLNNVYGLALVYLGKHRRGVTVLERAEQLARQHDQTEGLARVSNSLGIARQKLGELEGAERAYDEAGRLFAQLGDFRLAATAALNRGTLAQLQLRLDAALEAYQRVLELGHHAELGTTEAWACFNRASVLLICGDFGEARRVGAAALEALDNAASDGLCGHLLLLLSELARLENEPEQAEAWLKQASERFKEGDEAGAIALTLARGELALSRGEWKEARRSAEFLHKLVEPSAPEHWRAALLSARVAMAAAPPLLEQAVLELEALLLSEGLEDTCERTWELHAILADAQRRLGRKQRADHHARKFSESLAKLRQAVPTRYRQDFDARPDLLAARRAIAQAFSPREPAREALLSLISIYRDLNRGMPFDQLADRIIEAMVSLTGAERGFIIERAGRRFKVLVSRNLDGDPVAKPSTRYSQTIVARALHEGRPLLLGDAEQSHLADHPSIVDLRLRSVLCVPFSVRGSVHGALYLDNRFSPDLFDESAVLVVQGFAEQLGIALDNQRMLRELSTRSEQLAEAKRELEQLNQKLAARINQNEERLSEMSRRLEGNQQELVRRFRALNIVGRSKPMQELFLKLERVAKVDLPVYLHGESGTGKELAARAIHADGQRSHEPFVAINCAALPASLLESELFGHVRGAFTGADRDRPGVFEVAGSGTLFLDEVGDMNPEMQVKLLRVLQEGTYRRLGDSRERQSHCRILSASHHRLDTLVAEGRFREDLFYRINVLQIDLPALRERRLDIPLLVHSILDDLEQRALTVAPAAMSALVDFDWPGNIRQLQNELQRAVLLASGQIELADLSAELQHAGRVPRAAPAECLRESLRDFERQSILAALDQHDHNVTKVAQALGLHRVALHRRMKALGIGRKD